MHFKDLAVDVLYELASGLNALELCRLWICGCKILQKKLGDGGAARNFVVIGGPHYSTSFSRTRTLWPSLVSQFTRLTSVTLNFAGKLYDVGITAEMVLQLPPSLSSFVASFRSSLSVIVAAVSSSEYHLPNLTALSILDASNAALLNVPQPIKWPETLQSLRVTVATLDSIILSPTALPTTLTHLKMNSCDIPQLQKTQFPNSVTEMDLEFPGPMVPHFFSLLPSTLKHLHIKANFVPDASDCDWSMLPRGLETLNFPAYQFSREHCAQLPGTLTKIGSIQPRASEELLDALPPLIKSIDIHWLPVGSISPMIAKMLPRTLEEVESNSGRPGLKASAEGIPYLPPNLREVVCSSPSMAPLVAELQNLRLDVIPVALSRLWTQTCGGMDTLLALPRTLRELSIVYGPFSRPGLEYFKDLPSFNLTTLYLEQLQGNDIIPSEKWAECLPPTLTSLAIPVSNTPSASSPRQLPKYLRQLTIRANPACSFHLDWFKNLPDTLTALSMYPVVTVELPTRQEWHTEDLQTRIKFEFPTLLRELDLVFTGDRLEWIIPSVITSLPSSLITCKLSLPKGADSYLTDDDIHHLPPGLKALSAPKTSMLTNAGIEHASTRYSPAITAALRRMAR